MTVVTHSNLLLPFHAGLMEKLFNVYSPWTGVDLFFCISGVRRQQGIP
jgi:peptidoglycan/LPS O-acetylase OafA/YrhL